MVFLCPHHDPAKMGMEEHTCVSYDHGLANHQESWHQACGFRGGLLESVGQEGHRGNRGILNLEVHFVGPMSEVTGKEKVLHSAQGLFGVVLSDRD